MPPLSSLALNWDGYASQDEALWVQCRFEVTSDTADPVTFTVTPWAFTGMPADQPLGPVFNQSVEVVSGSVTNIYVPDWSYTLDLTNLDSFPEPSFNGTDGTYIGQILYEGTSQGATTMEITVLPGTVFIVGGFLFPNTGTAADYVASGITWSTTPVGVDLVLRLLP